VPEEAGLRRARSEDREALVALQMAAYEPNRAITGRTPWPLAWDYADVLARLEVWLLEDAEGLAGALILELRLDDLYIQSVAVAPRRKGRGIGNRLLALAERRAAAAKRPTLRLIANALMEFNVAWYGRKGYIVERIEAADGRRIVHMAKASATAPAS
jgi:ribosomal protein S18 acetylase RimI-like enzyme